MRVEIIGEVGTPGADPAWISAQATLAIRHNVKVCGPPPPEMELEVLLWEDAMRGTPWNYLETCRVALTAYENGGELLPGWSMPPVCSGDDDSNSAPFDPDKAPPDPPETLDVFESQRYISKFIQWGLEGSRRGQSRPHLVVRDDDEQRNPRRFLEPQRHDEAWDGNSSVRGHQSRLNVRQAISVSADMSLEITCCYLRAGGNLRVNANRSIKLPKEGLV